MVRARRPVPQALTTTPSDAAEDACERIEALLRRWSAGDRTALDALMPLVYDELRRLAEAQLRGESGATLPRTGLVHEVYLRLARHEHPVDLHSRQQFYGLAATVMRHVMVDRARARRAGKRGGGVPHLALDVTGVPMPDVAASDDTLDLLALDEAMTRLARLDPRQAQIVELRFFAGLSVEQAAEALGLSPATVKREWATARAWLLRALGRRPPQD